MTKFQELLEREIKKHASARQAANTLGITAVSLCDYQSGNKFPLLQNAKRMADRWGVTVDSFLEPAGVASDLLEEIYLAAKKLDVDGRAALLRHIKGGIYK